MKLIEKITKRTLVLRVDRFRLRIVRVLRWRMAVTVTTTRMLNVALVTTLGV